MTLPSPTAARPEMPVPQDTAMRLILVTGLSGSGKSIAIRQLEDLGWYCIDNLPVDMLTAAVDHLQANGHLRVAVSIDIRSASSFLPLRSAAEELTSEGLDVRVLFLTTTTPELVHRFSETRRQHPLSLKGDAPGKTLSEVIRIERGLLAPVMEVAHVIDTTRLRAATLREWVREFAGAPARQVTLAFESFAFKTGIPVAADLVFDARCLPNPYWEEGLRPLTGLDRPVADYLASKPETREFIDDIAGFITKWLPAYAAQNRHYITVAVGCTGGQHRSVYVAGELAGIFAGREGTGTLLRHRQLPARQPAGV